MGACVNANTAVVPANAGTHTPCPVVWAHFRRPGRHCERSEAIHLAAQRKNGLLRCARNDGPLVSDTTSSSRREAPELLQETFAQRGRGECRAHDAPAVSCALCIGKRTRVTTSTPKSPG